MRTCGCLTFTICARVAVGAPRWSSGSYFCKPPRTGRKRPCWSRSTTYLTVALRVVACEALKLTDERYRDHTVYESPKVAPGAKLPSEALRAVEYVWHTVSAQTFNSQ